MGRVSLKGSVNGTKRTATSTLSATAGDLVYKVSATDRTFKDGVTLDGLVFAVDKPGQFLAEYEALSKLTKFQFHHTARLFGKPCALKYSTTPQPAKASAIAEATATLDASHKVTLKHNILTHKSSVKYAFIPFKGLTLEPSYDQATGGVAVALTHKATSRDTVKATYDQHGQVATLDWTRTVAGGPVKLGCTIRQGEVQPLLTVEKTWNWEY